MNRTIFMLVASLALVAQACTSEEPATPSRPPVPPPSTGSSSGGADAGGEGDGGKDCFDTKTAQPTAPKEFLNQCNGTECFPFDNRTRIEGYVPGAALPPLN